MVHVRMRLGWPRLPQTALADDSVIDDVGAWGYRYVVMWTVDSLGWQGKPPSEVVRRCLERVSPGAILLFHVGSASTDAVALPTIIDELSAGGYTFSTVAELVGSTATRGS